MQNTNDQHSANLQLFAPPTLMQRQRARHSMQAGHRLVQPTHSSGAVQHLTSTKLSYQVSTLSTFETLQSHKLTEPPATFDTKSTSNTQLLDKSFSNTKIIFCIFTFKYQINNYFLFQLK